MLGSKIHAHYDITKFLGLGRFGETYLAKSKDLPGKPNCILKRFAVKLNDIERPLSLVKKIFEVQGEILYQLGQHDQIPRLLAKVEDGQNLYLIQEYIDGELLQQELISGQPWPQQQVIEMLQDILGILEFVHHQNFIHQDINPTNLMRRWRDGKFVLLGCGGVKDVASIWQQPTDSQPEQLVGTPGYIPFEQEDDNPQFNTDIYALGVIAIQGLTGTFPIERHPETYELSWKQLTTANLKLVEIIDKMVRPDYRNRYQLTREVLDDLKVFMSNRTQPDYWDKLQPHLIFGTAAAALMLGLAIPRLIPVPSVEQSQSASVNPAQAAAPSAPPLGRYQDPQLGFQFEYAPTWEQQNINNAPTGETVTLVSPKTDAQDIFQEDLTVRVETLANAQISLEQYTPLAIAEIRKFLPQAKIMETSSIQLAGRPAQLVTYSGHNPEFGELKILEVWTIKNGKAYILSYRAQPQQYYRFLQPAMTVINSFEIGK